MRQIKSLCVCSPLLLFDNQTNKTKIDKVSHRLILKYLARQYYIEYLKLLIEDNILVLIPYPQNNQSSILIFKNIIKKQLGDEISKKIIYFPINVSRKEVLLYPRDYIVYIPGIGYFVKKQGEILFNALQKFKVKKHRVYLKSPLGEGGKILLNEINKIIILTDDLTHIAKKYIHGYKILNFPLPSQVLSQRDTYRVYSHIDQFVSIFPSKKLEPLFLIDELYAQAILKHKPEWQDDNVLKICKDALSRNLDNVSFCVTSNELKYNPLNIVTLPDGKVICGSLKKLKKLSQWFLHNLGDNCIVLSHPIKLLITKAGLRCYSLILERS